MAAGRARQKRNKYKHNPGGKSRKGAKKKGIAERAEKSVMKKVSFFYEWNRERR
jgi:hypothetical protein